jgi:DNA-binding helix-hairpin-helix protein with protein kinase domain
MQGKPAHYFSGVAPSCPWCRLEAGYGTVLFVGHQPIGRNTFDLDYVVSKMGQIRSPGSAPDLISMMPPIENLKPSQAGKEFRRRVWARKAAGLATAGLATFVMFNGMGWGFFLLIPAGIVFFGEVTGAAAINRQRSDAESVWRHSIESWDREAGCRKFDDKKNDLLQTAASYRALPSDERNMLQAVEEKKRDLQMQKYLESHKLSRANIESIGDGRKMTLRSFGIETAWDVKSHSVRALPGFGPMLTGKLMDWRRSLEDRFRFNPNIPTDPAEIAKVRAAMAVRRSTMETELLKGVRDLETIREESLARRRHANHYERAYIAFRQAETDASSL